MFNKIICGNSAEVLKTIDDCSVDIIVTSPPYNFNRDYDNYDDSGNNFEYLDKLLIIWKECYRILKYNGRICINIRPMMKQHIPTHHIITNQLLRVGFLWKAEIIWDKGIYSCPYTCWGSWCSPSQPYIKSTWEYVNVYCKGTQKKEGNKDYIDITPEEFKEWTVGKWNIQPEQGIKKYNHPAVFPEKLVERLLKLFSYKNDVVLDPFNGVGTTTVIAKKLNREYIGIDVSRVYCDVAEDRLNEIHEELYI